MGKKTRAGWKPDFIKNFRGQQENKIRHDEIASCVGCGAPARRRLDGTWWISSFCKCEAARPEVSSRG